MNRKLMVQKSQTITVYAVTLLVFLLLLQQPTESKKVIIHVPYRVKNLKHTHTVYVVIPHEHHHKKDSEEDDKSDDY